MRSKLSAMTTQNAEKQRTLARPVAGDDPERRACCHHDEGVRPQSDSPPRRRRWTWSHRRGSHASIPDATVGDGVSQLDVRERAAGHDLVISAT